MKLPSLTEPLPMFEGIGHLDVLTFTKHIYLMIKSGIALPEAIDILEEQTVKPGFKKVLHQIHAHVANGQTLFKSLSFFPHVFDAFYINLIRVAEESGTLENNLNYLALHLEKQRGFKNKVRNALLYPTIVLSVALVSGVGLSIFVLPKLVDLFASLDVKLPLSTRILLFFSQTMKDYGVLIIGSVVLASLLFGRLVSTKIFKPRWQRFLLALPTLGTFIRDVELAALFRNLGMMLKVGIPIATALEVQSKTTNNIVYREKLMTMQEGVSKGKSLESVLVKNKNKHMPLIAVRMVGVGERTGRLDETLSYLGDFFEDEVDNSSKNLSTLLEPMILIFVGLMVAFIAMSIIGPIYQFTGSIQR